MPAILAPTDESIVIVIVVINQDCCRIQVSAWVCDRASLLKNVYSIVYCKGDFSLDPHQGDTKETVFSPSHLVTVCPQIIGLTPPIILGLTSIILTL